MCDALLFDIQPAFPPTHNEVGGCHELVTNEPEKHIPEWVDLRTIRHNGLVPDYYNELIRLNL